MKTIFAKDTDIEKKWHLIDADGLVVGRLAVKVADLLRGKNKAAYTPNADTGDFVVVVNAEKVRFTGNKLEQKKYYHHTGYPGGIKMATARELMEKSPEKVIMSAVRGMMPKNRLAKKQLSKLKVYSGSRHPHEAQNPEPLTTGKQ